MPADYIRRQTVKNAERYITPELKEFEDKVLGARERALARENELYDELLDQLIGAARRDCRRTAAALAALDVLAALAERAARCGSCEPQLVDESRLEIRGGRHPVVEQSLDGAVRAQRPVAATSAAHADHHRPEHGRQVDVHAPDRADRAPRAASAASCRPRPRRSARSTASSRASAPRDDLAGGRSTFMVEMTETANILNNATRTASC